MLILTTPFQWIEGPAGVSHTDMTMIFNDRLNGQRFLMANLVRNRGALWETKLTGSTTYATVVTG